MKQMNLQGKQQGFTLMELVAVIVVIGMLAAVGLPKFFGFQGESRAAQVNGAKMNLSGTAEMMHAKMLTTNSMPSTFEGVGPIEWSAHNPKGHSAGLVAGLNTVSGGAAMGMMWSGGTGYTPPGSDWIYVAPGATVGKTGTTNGIATTAVVLANTGNVAGGSGNEHAWVPASAATSSGSVLTTNATGCHVKYTDATLSGVNSTGTSIVIGPFVTSVTTTCSLSGM